MNYNEKERIAQRVYTDLVTLASEDGKEIAVGSVVMIIQAIVELAPTILKIIALISKPEVRVEG